MNWILCPIEDLKLNPHWHELWKQEKYSSLAPPRRIFYKTQWTWQGVKLTWLMSIFTSKKVWKFLIEIQLTKIWSKNDKEIKVSPLVPINQVSTQVINFANNCHIIYKFHESWILMTLMCPLIGIKSYKWQSSALKSFRDNTSNNITMKLLVNPVIIIK